MIMSNKFAVLTVASVPLLLAVSGALAGEPSFKAPATDRAQQARPLLNQAALTLSAESSRAGGRQVGDLWLFPTAQEDTVFAQYTVTANEHVPAGPTASEKHFEVLKMQGDRIVERRDLRHASDENALQAKRTPGERDRSALIGTGRAAGPTEASSTATGAPGSPHWSAAIGSGQVRDDSIRQPPAAASLAGTRAASAHWTSKIGTAMHAEPTT
jgi:hypothetical protein